MSPVFMGLGNSTHNPFCCSPLLPPNNLLLSYKFNVGET